MNYIKEILLYCSLNLWPQQRPSHFAVKASTIQEGQRKCGTHARVFSRKFAYRIARMKEDKETEKEDKQKRVKINKVGRK